MLWGKITTQEKWRRSLAALRNAVVFSKNQAYQSFRDPLKVRSGRNLMVSHFVRGIFIHCKTTSPRRWEWLQQCMIKLTVSVLHHKKLLYSRST